MSHIISTARSSQPIHRSMESLSSTSSSHWQLIYHHCHESFLSRNASTVSCILSAPLDTLAPHPCRIYSILIEFQFSISLLIEFNEKVSMRRYSALVPSPSPYPSPSPSNHPSIPPEPHPSTLPFPALVVDAVYSAASWAPPGCLLMAPFTPQSVPSPLSSLHLDKKNHYHPGH